MKKAIAVLLALTLALAMAGCSPYSSKYDAVAFVHSNTSTAASMSFSEFEGVMVFHLKQKSDKDRINYAATLESGSATVYYDCDGSKTTLFTIGKGGHVKSTLTACPAGKITIIVETSEKCLEGDFQFEVAEPTTGK